jgi:hypothetical protein
MQIQVDSSTGGGFFRETVPLTKIFAPFTKQKAL